MPNPMDPEVPPPGAGVATVICAVAAAATSAAEIAAVSCVALRNVVVRAAPFQRTVELLTKPLPFTRSVRGRAPAVTPVGVSPVSPGTGLFTVNVRAPEVPPPGAGVITVTCGVPAAATSAAAMAAVSCVALTKTVVRAAPFQLTVEPPAKLLPVTVSVKAAFPAAALAGDRVESVGDGLLTLNVWAAEVPPPGAGVTTVTCGVPAAATSAAAMAAVSCVALTKVVVRVAPFHLTVLPLTKPVPVTVSVKAGLPADVLVGDRAARGGAELLTVNVWAAEVPPPGAGVTTVTDAVVAAARSVAGIAAVSWVALTNVVVRVAPFQLTVLPVTKSVPATVRVKAGPATLALVGER